MVNKEENYQKILKEINRFIIKKKLNEEHIKSIDSDSFNEIITLTAKEIYQYLIYQKL